MKSLLVASAAVLLAVLSVQADASLLRTRSGKFASLQEEAQDFASLSVPQYIQRLEHALRSSRTSSSEHAQLVQHLNYYRSIASSVKASVRGTQSGTVHDCVGFAQQPALFDAPASEIEAAHAAWMQATNGGALSTEAICGAGTLPVPRPIVKFGDFTEPKLVVAPLKQNALKSQVPPGYSYVDSAFANTSAGTQFTYTVLGVGEGVGSAMPSTPIDSEQDHSINQMWWVDETVQRSNIKTLEAGWIHSNYWSTLPETQLFVFSTPDGYQGSQYDQYNYAGDFIGYPGAPALQKGVSSVQYLWKYSIMSDNKGYEMKLTPFSNNSAQTGYEFGAEIALGYFPMKRYTKYGKPNFSTLQTGQELDQSSNSSKLHAGGKIFGWGTDTERYPILNNFTDFGKPIPFSYGTKPTFTDGNRFTGSHFVEFHGDNCGMHC